MAPLRGRDRSAERDTLALHVFPIERAYGYWRLAHNLQAIVAGQEGV